MKKTREDIFSVMCSVTYFMVGENFIQTEEKQEFEPFKTIVKGNNSVISQIIVCLCVGVCSKLINKLKLFFLRNRRTLVCKSDDYCHFDLPRSTNLENHSYFENASSCLQFVKFVIRFGIEIVSFFIFIFSCG